MWRRVLVLFFFMNATFLFAQNCSDQPDSVLSVWYKNYKLSYVRGEYWKGAALGQQILRHCPKWKPEIYRETGLMYQSLLDTIHNLYLYNQIKDSLYQIYDRAVLATGDKAGWALIKANAALKYENESDSLLGLILEPAIRMHPLKCPPKIIEDYFRICDWKTRRGRLDSVQLEAWYQYLNIILARQYIFKDSAWEKEQIVKVKKQLAFRMRPYLPDSAALIQEALLLNSNNYTDWIRLYARLFARGIEQAEVMGKMQEGLQRTGQETLWEARELLTQSASEQDWLKLASREQDTLMKAWYILKAADYLSEKEQYQDAWALYENARNTAPGYGGAEISMARFLMNRAHECSTFPEDAQYLYSAASAHYYLGIKKDFSVRNQALLELEVLPENISTQIKSGQEVHLQCTGFIRFKFP